MIEISHNLTDTTDPTHEEILSKEELIRRTEQMRASFTTLIDKHGFAVMGVTEASAYTIGLAKKSLPDLVVTLPIPHNASAEIMKAVWTKWTNHGYALTPLTVEFGELSLNLQLRPLARSKALLEQLVVQAELFYEAYPAYHNNRAPLPDYVQIVLPDQDGNFPTEAQYNSEEFPQVVYDLA